MSKRREVDLLAYTKRSLINMKGAGGLAVVSAPELPRKMVDAAARYPPQDVAMVTSLRQGWARRPAKGKMYGAKYIHLYIKDVQELFARGAADKADKVGPARVVEILVEVPGQVRYPSRGGNPPSDIRFVRQTAQRRYCFFVK